MYRNLNNTISNETRTLEIHQGVSGWYFTIHRGTYLLFQSPEEEDRIQVTQAGMCYFDAFCGRNYEIHITDGVYGLCKKREETNG